MQGVLSRLIEEPYDQFTIGQLAEMVGGNQANVSKAVKLLKQLGTVQTRQEGRKQYVSIHRDRLTEPDPVLSIPQSEFHKPIRAVVDRVQPEVDDSVGVLLFGSVARGTADRASDIDILVFVEDDKTKARRTVRWFVSTLQQTKFVGDRSNFEALVEAPESAKRIGDRLRQQFDEGFILVRPEQLSDIRRRCTRMEMTLSSTHSRPSRNCQLPCY